MHAFYLKTGTFLFSVLLSLVFCPDAAWAEAALNFSRSPRQLNSPDKSCVIKNNIASPNEGSNLLYVEEPDELLLIKKEAKHSKTKLLKYHRNVDVFWAPNSKVFVVNDWKDNNYCDALLYDLSSLQKPISLKQKLVQSKISEEERSLVTNKEYSYVFLEKWHKPTELFVKASGHYFLNNKTVAYTLHYLWEMKTNTWKLLKKESKEDFDRSIPNMKQFGA